MKRVLTAVVLIPLVFGIIIFAPTWLFVVALGVVGLVSVFEFLRMSQKFSAPPFAIPLTIIACVFIVLTVEAKEGLHAAGAIAPELLACLMLLLPFVFLARPLSAPDLQKSLIGCSLAFIGVLYVCVPLVCLIRIKAIDLIGNFFLILLLIAVWSGDIAALYVGRLIGKHKLAPRVSPGKTWEGAIASFLFSIGIVCLITQILGPKLSGSGPSRYLGHSFWEGGIEFAAPPIWVPICFGALINCAAQLGDLTESMMKRAAGVKDSGTLLPGHGGLLDRIDALLFAAPIGMVLFLVTESLFHAQNMFRIELIR
jgi:phosphatidate cytidylyltransferase